MEFWYLKEVCSLGEKKKNYEDNFKGLDILNSKENEWPKGLCIIIIIGMNVQTLQCHTRLSLS